jgi:hypothetical protein
VACLPPGDVQLERVDLALAVGAGLDRAGGADQVAHSGQRVRPQALADVDRGQARQGDPLRIGDDEVGVAVAVGVDPLDEGDPPLGAATARQTGRAPRGRNRFGSRRLLSRRGPVGRLLRRAGLGRVGALAAAPGRDENRCAGQSGDPAASRTR